MNEVKPRRRSYTPPKLEELSPVDPKVLRVRAEEWLKEWEGDFGVAIHLAKDDLTTLLEKVAEDARRVELEVVGKALEERIKLYEDPSNGEDFPLLQASRVALKEFLVFLEKGGHRT